MDRITTRLVSRGWLPEETIRRERRRVVPPLQATEIAVQTTTDGNLLLQLPSATTKTTIRDKHDHSRDYPRRGLASAYGDPATAKHDGS